MSKGGEVNLRHLRERLIQSGHITENVDCTEEEVKEMLRYRFDSIDFLQAKKDVEPFIHDTNSLNIWSADFFKQITESLRTKL